MLIETLSKTLSSSAPIAISAEQRSVIAVAIGRYNCQVVVVQQQWDGTCAIQQAADVPLRASTWEQPRELGNVINQQLMQMMLPKSVPIACILPAGLVEYELLDLPDGVADVDTFVTSSLEQILGREKNAVTHAYWQAGTTEVTDPVYVCWTPSVFASELTNCVLRSGRECIALEPLAPVLAQIGSSLVDAGQTGIDGKSRDGLHPPAASRLIVFLEGNQATSLLACGDLPFYVRSQIGLSDQSPQQLVEQNLNVGPQNALTLLRDWGIAGSIASGKHVTRPIQQAIAAAIQPWSKELIFELQRTLRFLRHRYGVHELQQVILCGEGAVVAGLAEHLTNELDQNVRPAQLPAHCRWLSAEAYSEAYAAPLAMALQGASA